MTQSHQNTAAPNLSSASYFHVHMISDSTGETLSAILKATAARFEVALPLEHVASSVNSPKKMNEVLARIEGSPGLVMYTIVDPGLRRHLEVKCAELQVPAISVLDPMLNAFTDYLGVQQTMRSGAQHKLDDDYFRRIAALDYTLAHDDGQMAWDLEGADVVLVGVSRTSKTPTCMYLANRGIKAANVPLVPTQDFPPELAKLQHPLVVGLTATPDRLQQIRSTRLKNINADGDMNYADADLIKQEIIKAKRYFAKNGWPIIDVSRRSVEETAANIISRLSARKSGYE
ncbi:MAG: pyruvate, water dikinase regulatory protein [Parvularculaceae bacterium]